MAAISLEDSRSIRMRTECTVLIEARALDTHSRNFASEAIEFFEEAVVDYTGLG